MKITADSAARKASPIARGLLDSTIDQHERRPYKRVSIRVVWRDRQGVSTTAYHSIRQAWQGGRAILSGLA